MSLPRAGSSTVKLTPQTVFAPALHRRLQEACRSSPRRPGHGHVVRHLVADDPRLLSRPCSSAAGRSRGRSCAARGRWLPPGAGRPGSAVMRAPFSWVATARVGATVCTPTVKLARSGVSVTRPVPVTLTVSAVAGSRGTGPGGVCAWRAEAAAEDGGRDVRSGQGESCARPPCSRGCHPLVIPVSAGSDSRKRLSRAKALPAMADPVLVLGTGLAERAAEGRIEEERVVPEAVRALRFLRDEPLDVFLRVEEDVAPAHDRDRAREPRAALVSRHAAELLEEQPVAVGVASPLPRRSGSSRGRARRRARPRRGPSRRPPSAGPTGRRSSGP